MIAVRLAEEEDAKVQAQLIMAVVETGCAACTLEEAVAELARRTGMRRTFSERITEVDRRTPSSWPWRKWDLDDIASTWGGLAAFVIEPGEIRVMPPEKALAFWEGWARSRDGQPRER